MAGGCLASGGADGGPDAAGEPCPVVEKAQTKEPPLPPTFISASDGLFDDRVELVWSEVPEATSYNVYISDTIDSQRIFVGVTNQTSARIRGTAPGILKFFWVFAENQFGESRSGAFDAGFVAASATPAAPTAVVASDGTFEDRVRITWADVAGETFYRLYRCATPIGITCGEPISMPAQDATSYDDMHADPHGALSFYRMQACNENGCSKFSAANSGFRQPVGLIFKHGFE